MADTKTPDTGADEAPGGGAQDEGGSPFKDRIKELQAADDATIQDMLAGAPAMDPSSGDDDGAGDSFDEGEDDAEGQRVSGQDDGEHLEGEDPDEEEGERGGSEDAGDVEGEQPDDDAGDEEGERDGEVDDDEEELELEDLLEEEGFALVKLPARHEGDPDFELPLDLEMLDELGIDPSDAVERLNQMRNGYQYRAEVDAELEAVREDQAELDSIQAALEEDPAGFLTSSVAPAVRNDVAENLVLSLDEEAFSELADKVVRWARNPESRTTAATAAENERLKKERDAVKVSRTKKQLTNQIRDIGKAIRSLVPDTMKERTQKRFVKLAAAELRDYVREQKLETLDPEEVPTILSDLGVLEDFNLSNGRKSSASGNDRPKSRKRGSSKKDQPKSSAGKKAKKKDVRERLKRRKRAASTPAGAGSAAASGFTKVPGESHEERMTRLRRHLGVPKKKGRR